MKLHDFLARIAAPVLSSSSHQCYLYQRALQQDDRWPKGKRGPGGGPDATPRTAALLILALMAGGNKRQILERTWNYFTLPAAGPVHGGDESGDKPPVMKSVPCPLTGKSTFGEALQALLADKELAKMVIALDLIQTWPEATIYYREDLSSQFINGQGELGAKNAAHFGGLRTMSGILGRAIVEMADALQ